MGKTVLITGASGFIGKHLSAFLKKHGHTIIGLDKKAGDITQAATWDRIEGADIVVHLAARSFVPDSWNEVPAFMECNLGGTLQALDFCRKQKAHLIFLSSYIYGRPETLPIKESASLSVNNPYALSKKMAEEACEFYAINFGIKVTVLRPFNAYGPNQSPVFLIPSLIRQVKETMELHVKDLEPKRDFIYVEDLVDAIHKTFNYTGQFDIFNIGSGTSYSVKQLIDLIQGHANKNLPVYSEERRRKDEIMDTVADISKAKEKLGWEPKWTLSSGIRQILKEY